MQRTGGGSRAASASGGRRVALSRNGLLAVLFTLLLASSGVAAGGVAASAAADGPTTTGSQTADRQTAGGPTVDSAVTAGSVESAIARRADSPASSSQVTRTPVGGYARSTGTADVLGTAPTTIRLTQRIALTPDDPGAVEITQIYRIPETVSSVETRRPEGASVTAVEGFTDSGGGAYEWDGETARATLTFTMRVNETVQKEGPEGAEGEYLFADAGSWALIQRPEVPISWGWRGAPVGVEREATTAGPGHVGQWMVYLGRHETHTRTAHGQEFTLVVPDRASLAEPPGAILDGLATASGDFRVGDRDDSVSVFAAPTTSVAWGVRGLQVGEADMWVRDEERLDVADNPWFHEYVHTRQDFETAPTGRWITEATATYYAALLALENDFVDFAAFREFLGRGAAPPQSGATLSEPATWANAANYRKGALVAGAIDRQVRLATDGTRSLGSVVSRLNARTEPVDGAAFRETVAAFAPSVGEYVTRYATTSQVPDRWDSGAHEAAFGSDPAAFTARFGAPDRGTDAPTFDLSGPFRNETLAGDHLTVYTGERLNATASVTNFGGATADYERSFTVDGRSVRTVNGSLAASETAAHEFGWTATAEGEYRVAFDSDAVTVRVHDPEEASLANLRVNRTRLDGPGAVAVEVTVANRFGAPAQREFSVTRDGETVATRRVSLAPNRNRTLTVPVRLPETGAYTIGVGGGSVTVQVQESGGNGLLGGGNGDGGSGDGGSGAGDGGSGGSGDGGSGDGSGEFDPGIGQLLVFLALAGVVFLALVAVLVVALLRR